MKSLLLLAFILTGCGAYEGTGFMEPYDYDAYEVPDDFAPFVATFKDELAKRNIDINMKPLIMKFAVLPKDDKGNKTLGECTIYTVSAPKIEIDPNDWAEHADDYYWHEFLIFHELGHCKLRRDHDEVILGNGLKESIMYPNHLGKDYAAHRDYYVNELFSKRNDLSFGLYNE